MATVLSAQCTDARVNQVTPVLFDRWPGPAELAAAPAEDVEDVIRPLGMFRQKTSALQKVAQAIIDRHNGEVPAEIDALVALPGVGRKTAKVVLGEGFGIPAGVTVDTHVRRLARRLGLTDLEDPEKIAAELERSPSERRVDPIFYPVDPPRAPRLFCPVAALRRVRA